MNILILFALLIFSSAAMSANNRVDYKAEFKSEDLARRFFGPLPKEELEVIAVKVGKVDINLKTSIDCGNINIHGTIKAEIEKLEEQLTTALATLTRLNPSQLALAAVCATEPELCTYARDMGAKFGEIFAMQFNVCNSIDSYISDKADEGRKSILQRNFNKCMSKYNKDGYTKKQAEACRAKAKEKSEIRDLLKPFKESYVKGKQNVLDSILSAAQESKHYNLLAKILGEIELQKNGLWVKAFPEDRLSPSQAASKFLRESDNISCNINALESIVKAKDPAKDKEGIEKYITQSIKDKISPEIIFDLKSLPEQEKKIICRNLGNSIGESAIKKFEAESKSALSVSLKNNALPDDIKSFYEENSKNTFEAIQKKMASKEIPPFEEIKNKLQTIASNYRRMAHEAAAGASRNRSTNNRSNELFKCVDTATCDKSSSIR